MTAWGGAKSHWICTQRKCQFWLGETQTRTTTTNDYLKRRLVYSFNSISCCGNCSWICRFSTSSQRSKFVFDIHSVHFILHKTNTWPIWTYYLSSTNPLATWWQHFLWVFWFKWSIKYQKGWWKKSRKHTSHEICRDLHSAMCD